MFMDGVVDNVAAKQKIDFFSPKSGKRADMMVYRSVGPGCEIGSVARESLFFCEKSMLQQWVPLVEKRFGQLLLLPRSEMYKYVVARELSCRSKGGRETLAEATSRPLTLLPPHTPSSKVGDEEEKLCWDGRGKRGICGDVCGMKKIQKAAELFILSPHPNKKAGKGLMWLCRVLRSGWGIERNGRKKFGGFCGRWGLQRVAKWSLLFPPLSSQLRINKVALGLRWVREGVIPTKYIKWGVVSECVCASCRREWDMVIESFKQTLPKEDGESRGVDMLKTREEQKLGVRATKDFGGRRSLKLGR